MREPVQSKLHQAYRTVAQNVEVLLIMVRIRVAMLKKVRDVRERSIGVDFVSR